MNIAIDTIPIDHIRIDGGTQSRAELNDAKIIEYTEVIRSGIDLPPVVTFFDGVSFWLADGFHRFHAYKAAGAVDISSEMHDGTCREAVLFSLGANKAHGLPPNNADKRKSALTMLQDNEWSTWSDNSIARACGVSVSFIGDVRRSIYSRTIDATTPTVRTVERNGTTYEQNTANIGRGPNAPLSENPRATEPYPENRPDPRRNLEPQPKQEQFNDAPDMVQLADELQKENEAYQRQIKSLTTDDATAEVVRLNDVVDRMSGRLQGEVTTRNEAQKMVEYYAALLGKIRKALGVESNKDILSALVAK